MIIAPVCKAEPQGHRASTLFRRAVVDALQLALGWLKTVVLLGLGDDEVELDFLLAWSKRRQRRAVWTRAVRGKDRAVPLSLALSPGRTQACYNHDHTEATATAAPADASS